MPTPDLNARVAQRIEVAPGLIILRVVPEGWEFPPYEAGQFAVLGLPGSAPRYAFADQEDEAAEPDKLIKRAYSIASSSRIGEYLEFYITLVRSGRLTPRLFALETGDRLWLGRKATGMFQLDQAPAEAHVVFVATGTGLAPYMSMLRTHLVCGGPRRFAVIHGARHSWDLGYRSELQTLANLCSNFHYLPVVSRPEEETLPWTGRTGYVQDCWRSGAVAEAWGAAPAPADTHVFLCGGPGMVEAMLEVLGEEGFREHRKAEAGQVHVERYW
ncbi:MAG: ferredoxin--NADP reductase [Planctomycetota bacterium]|nr:MAG: ferredoxin--NADP reductase [Planctomycetota bacterium]